MNQLSGYLLQSIVVSGILWSYYYFALRNRRFHQYNRYYLLAIPVLSILIPMLNIPVYFTGEQISSSPLLQSLPIKSINPAEDNIIITTALSEKKDWFNIAIILKLTYLICIAVFVSRLIISLLKIRYLINKYPQERMNIVRFMNTDEPGTPFSFFNWLFWNKNTALNSERGNQMFRHELYHIRERHTADIIYIEIISAIFWINPFFHFIKKELRAIHEFLADRFALTENSRWQYAEMLLMKALDTQQKLVNPFFHNQIKRRIAMITQSSKPEYQYLKKLMVLPLIALTIVFFAFSYHSIKETDSEQARKGTKHSTTENNLLTDTSKPVKGTNNIYDKVDREAVFPGGDNKWRQYLERNLDASVPIKNKAPRGTYTVVVMFVVDVDGKLSDIKALTKHGFGMEQEAIRVITEGPRWEPAVVKGKQVKAYKRQPITFVSGEGANINPPARNSDDLGEVVVVSLANATNASFPGGPEKWKEYLIYTIKPTVPVDSGAPGGIYKTIIRFIVNADGSLSDFSPVTHHGYGMEKEVIRLLKAGPRWIPATVEGKKIASYVEQPVTFQVSEETENDITNSSGQQNIPEISVSAIKKTSVLELLQLPANTQVISFMFTTDLPNGDIAEAPVNGNNWSAPASRLIASLTPGKLVTLDLIKILRDGNEVKIPSKAYRVVN